jgi:hypothetical protein
LNEEATQSKAKAIHLQSLERLEQLQQLERLEHLEINACYLLSFPRMIEDLNYTNI